MTQAYTERFTEVHKLGDWQQPMTHAPGTVNTDWEPMANNQRAVYILLLGATALNGTLNMTIYEATDAAGTDPQAIAGKTITQLTNAAGDATSAVVIEVRSEELDPGHSYVRAAIVTGGGNMTYAVVPLFGCSNYVPVATTNWSEIVD